MPGAIIAQRPVFVFIGLWRSDGGSAFIHLPIFSLAPCCFGSRGLFCVRDICTLGVELVLSVLIVLLSMCSARLLYCEGQCDGVVILFIFASSSGFSLHRNFRRRVTVTPLCRLQDLLGALSPKTHTVSLLHRTPENLHVYQPLEKSLVRFVARSMSLIGTSLTGLQAARIPATCCRLIASLLCPVSRFMTRLE